MGLWGKASMADPAAVQGAVHNGWPKAWASWNYRLGGEGQKRAAVTYDMNILQGIQSETTVCVSLNQTAAIGPL